MISIKIKKKIRLTVMICSVLLLIGCVIFLIYYLGIQPYHSKQLNNKYKSLYYSVSDSPESDGNNEVIDDDSSENTPVDINLDKSYEEGAKGSDGILLKFSKLIEINSDIRGWLKVPGTNIDYPVMQSTGDSEFYLKHDFEGGHDKNGCLYIQSNSKIKPRSKNLVIHGHNMDSTGMMFHQLLKYKDIEFYKQHPVITFDTLYKESKWKIIGYMRVAGDFESSDGFNYLQSTFQTKEQFLNFVYQIEIRSSYKCPVDINEKDSLLMLSTCSYEVHDYRTVVVCRKLRKNESSDVDTSLTHYNKNVLYPSSWYKKYGGEKPTVTSFENAMSFNEIDWYDGSLEVESSVNKTCEVDGYNFKILSNSAVSFEGVKDYSIKSLEIPSTIKFQGRVFDVTTLSKKAFDNLTKLKHLKIGNKVEIIPKKAFVNCPKLEEVIIGDSVNTIEEKAFYKLSNLKYIKIRSNNLDSLEENAFSKIYVRAKFKVPKSMSKAYTKLINKCVPINKFKFKEYSEDANK